MMSMPGFLAVLTVGAVAASSTPTGDRLLSDNETTPKFDKDPRSISSCDDRPQVLSLLTQTFSEAPFAVGKVDGDVVLEIFASEGGTWTIVTTGTDGVSCIISFGEAFEDILSAP